MDLSNDISSNYSNEASLGCDFMDNSPPVQVAKLLVLSIILVISLLGNALLIVIVYKRRELRKTANYFIVNMAVSDFVFPLQMIPFFLAQIAANSMNWPVSGTLGSILCKLGVFLRRVSATVSVGSLLCIAFDRCIAVMWPMKAHLITPTRRAIALACTWVVALIVNCMDLYVYDLVTKGNTHLCEMLPGKQTEAISYIGYTRRFIYIGPVVVIIVLYSRTIMTLRRKDKVLSHSEAPRAVKNKQRAIKTSFSVVITIVVCFLPWFFVLPLIDFLACSLLRELLFLAYVMFFLSSVINPLVCMLCVQSFRKGLIDVVGSCGSSSKERTCHYNLETRGQDEHVTPT